MFRARLIVVAGSLLTCLSIALTWAIFGRSLARRDRALHEATTLHLADGPAVVDREDRFVFWNPRMEEIYGVPAAAAVGRLLGALAASLYARTADPAETLRRSHGAYAAARTGTPPAFEYACRREDGVPRDLAVLLFPIVGPDGTPMGHGRLVRDVTKEREVDRLKDELASVVSHELRTPLASLVGFAELLLAHD